MGRDVGGKKSKGGKGGKRTAVGGVGEKREKKLFNIFGSGASHWGERTLGTRNCG